jgi:transcriptional regulator with XRE-family HTH domain
MLGGMGYKDKLQRLCALRGMDQSALASQVGLSKSSISRILNGAQEPKLRLAYDLAKALGVTLDYLVDDSPEAGPGDQLVMVSEDELTILKIVRRLGSNVSLDRLVNSPSATGHETAEPKSPLAQPQHPGGRTRSDLNRGTS